MNIQLPTDTLTTEMVTHTGTTIPVSYHKVTRFGVVFKAQTRPGLLACMKRYYALPRYKRKGTWLVTPEVRWKKKKKENHFLS